MRCLTSNTTSDITPISSRTAETHGSKPSAAVSLPLLTESRCQVARRCLREERLRYVDSVVPVAKSDALRFGTLWHHGQEAWWLSDAADRLANALGAVRGHATPDTDAYELARCEAMLIGYDERWRGEQYEVISVEAEFRAPLVNPETGAASRTFQRAGKIDAIVRDATGRKLNFEHKTSGEDVSPGSSFWARLRMGGQTAGYIRGAESLGHQVDGVVYDVARKPALKPLQANSRRDRAETPDEYRTRCLEAIAEDPDKYFQRGLVVRLEEQMAEADSELWQLGQTLREHHRLGLAPRNVDACQRYGNTCSYFSICAGESSADDDRQFRRLEWAHPELTK